MHQSTGPARGQSDGGEGFFGGACEMTATASAATLETTAHTAPQAFCAVARCRRRKFWGTRAACSDCRASAPLLRRVRRRHCLSEGPGLPLAHHMRSQRASKPCQSHPRGLAQPASASPAPSTQNMPGHQHAPCAGHAFIQDHRPPRQTAGLSPPEERPHPCQWDRDREDHPSHMRPECHEPIWD